MAENIGWFDWYRELCGHWGRGSSLALWAWDGRGFFFACLERRFILQLISIYLSAKIYYPANLTMEEYSCLASEVDCYNVVPIVVGANTTVSQGVYLCTASHDITDRLNPLITAPIILKDQTWIGAKAYIGMGVTIGQGAVVGATPVCIKMWSLGR